MPLYDSNDPGLSHAVLALVKAKPFRLKRMCGKDAGQVRGHTRLMWRRAAFIASYVASGSRTLQS